MWVKNTSARFLVGFLVNSPFWHIPYNVIRNVSNNNKESAAYVIPSLDHFMQGSIFSSVHLQLIFFTSCKIYIDSI